MQVSQEKAKPKKTIEDAIQEGLICLKIIKNDPLQIKTIYIKPPKTKTPQNRSEPKLQTATMIIEKDFHTFPKDEEKMEGLDSIKKAMPETTDARSLLKVLLQSSSPENRLMKL